MTSPKLKVSLVQAVVELELVLKEAGQGCTSCEADSELESFQPPGLQASEVEEPSRALSLAMASYRCCEAQGQLADPAVEKVVAPSLLQERHP